MHLLFPLLASLLLVSGLIFVKYAGNRGVNPITTLVVTNLVASFAFTLLWPVGGTFQGWNLLWQPAIIAALFIIGLGLTFAAIEKGDVSIATPIMGVKVVFVALLLTFFGFQKIPISVWFAAVMSALGIALIQQSGKNARQRVALTIALSIAASFSFATFDVLVQHWAPAWGAGRFLPIVYWMVGLGSLTMAPWVNWKQLRQPYLAVPLLIGAVLIAIQAICIVGTVSVYGDAARVNIVFALRGFWGVLLAWLAAHLWGGAEKDHPRAVMLSRLAGALALTCAVILAILANDG